LILFLCPSLLSSALLFLFTGLSFWLLIHWVKGLQDQGNIFSHISWPK